MSWAGNFRPGLIEKQHERDKCAVEKGGEHRADEKACETSRVHAAKARAVHRMARAEDRAQLVRMPPVRELSDQLRRYLGWAGVTRAELFADDETRAPLTFHDLRATGITWRAVRGDDALKIQRALADNGSPPAEIDCDPTFFSVRIPIHSRTASKTALSLNAAGHSVAALETIKRAFAREPSSWYLTVDGIALAGQGNDLATARAFLNKYLEAAGRLTDAYPALQFINLLVLGVPLVRIVAPLSPQSLGPLQEEVSAYLAKILKFVVPGWILSAAYWLWCTGELGEALARLEMIDWSQPQPYLDRLSYEALLAGIRLDLAAQLEAEIAEQLLLETENRLEETIEFLQGGGAESQEAGAGLGGLYLRLAQTRQLLGKPSRVVSVAARLAHHYAARVQDAEALKLI